MRVADVIRPKTGQHITAFRQISQKHLDFVIAAADWTIVAAVELNDKSHERSDRRARDALLQRAFTQAGVSLHFLPVKARYHPQELALLTQPPP